MPKDVASDKSESLLKEHCEALRAFIRLMEQNKLLTGDETYRVVDRLLEAKDAMINNDRALIQKLQKDKENAIALLIEIVKTTKGLSLTDVMIARVAAVQEESGSKHQIHIPKNTRWGRN